MNTATFEVNGTRIACSFFGPTTDITGAPIVATPSLFMDRTALYPIAAFLAGHGRRVYVLDHRGQGDSAAGSGAELSMPALAADNAALIEHLGIGPVDYIGTSQGGMVAAWLLAEHSHLLRTVVAAGSSAHTERRRAEFDPLVEHLTTHGATGELDTPDGPTDVITVLTRIMFGEWTIRNHPVLVEHWAGHFRTLGPAIGEAAHHVVARPELPDLTDTGIPVLALAGAQDAAYPPEISADGFALATGGTSATIQRAGHTPLTEHPDLAGTRLLTFYSEHAR